MSGGPGWLLQGVGVTCILERAAGCTIRRLLGILGGDGADLKRLLRETGKEDSVGSMLGAELLGLADGLESTGERKRSQEEHLGFWLKLVSRSYS